MNTALLAKLTRAQRKAQNLVSETITLGPANNQTPPITAILGKEYRTQVLKEGSGMDEVILLPVSVVLGDLAKGPYTGQPAQARAKSWRVFKCDTTQTTYEITLESPAK